MRERLNSSVFNLFTFLILIFELFMYVYRSLFFVFYTHRRETTPSSQLRAESSDELDSTARPSSAANSRRRSTGVKMPTESELDDFFSEAEKNIKKQFAEK